MMRRLTKDHNELLSEEKGQDMFDKNTFEYLKRRHNKKLVREMDSFIANYNRTLKFGENKNQDELKAIYKENEDSNYSDKDLITQSDFEERSKLRAKEFQLTDNWELDWANFQRKPEEKLNLTIAKEPEISPTDASEHSSEVDLNQKWRNSSYAESYYDRNCLKTSQDWYEEMERSVTRLESEKEKQYKKWGIDLDKEKDWEKEEKERDKDKDKEKEKEKRRREEDEEREYQKRRAKRREEERTRQKARHKEKEKERERRHRKEDAQRRRTKWEADMKKNLLVVPEDFDLNMMQKNLTEIMREGFCKMEENATANKTEQPKSKKPNKQHRHFQEFIKNAYLRKDGRPSEIEVHGVREAWELRERVRLRYEKEQRKKREKEKNINVIEDKMEEENFEPQEYDMVTPCHDWKEMIKDKKKMNFWGVHKSWDQFTCKTNGQMKTSSFEPIPSHIKKHFFPNRCMPDLQKYDVFALNAEHALVEFDWKQMSRHIVESTLGFLHEKYGYPKCVTEFDYDKNMHWCLESGIFDIRRGTVVKLDEKCEVIRAVRGYEILKYESIINIYGDPPVFNMMNYPDQLRQRRYNPHALVDWEYDEWQEKFLLYTDHQYWIMMGHFDRCMIPIVNHLVFHYKRGYTEKRQIIPKPMQSVIYDLFEIYYDHFVRYRIENPLPIRQQGKWYDGPNFLKKLISFVKPNPKGRQLIAALKASKKEVVLCSDGNEEYLDRIMTRCIGNDWLDLFDLVITRMQRPLFQTTETPFYQVGGNFDTKEVVRVKTSTRLKKHLSFGKIFREGNARTLTAFYEEKFCKPVKIAHFGSDYKRDIWGTFFFTAYKDHEVSMNKDRPENLRKCLHCTTFVSANSSWESIAIMEELDEKQYKHDTERWGENYFYEKGRRDDSIKRNYFCMEVAKCARYAIPSLYCLEDALKSQAMKPHQLNPATGVFVKEYTDADMKMSSRFMEDLTRSLQGSLDANTVIRQESEKFIMNARNQKGYSQALLEISSHQTLSRSVKLAAAVQLGKYVQDNWSKTTATLHPAPNDKLPVVPQEDQEYIRSNIMQKMLHCELDPVLRQYMRCITTMAGDYPKKWPFLMRDICAALQQPDLKAVKTGINAMHAYADRYEYTTAMRTREFVDEGLGRCFGALTSVIQLLYQQLIAKDNAVMELFIMICQVFNLANSAKLLPFFKCKVALNPWMVMARTILDFETPEKLRTFTENADIINERDKSTIWTLKGVASKMTVMVFVRRVLRKGQLEKFEYDFAQYLVKDCAVVLLAAHMRKLLSVRSEFVGTQTLRYAIRFIHACAKVEAIMKEHLKPHIEEILYTAAIPIIQTTHKELQVFEEDPLDFIKMHQDADDKGEPKTLMIEFIYYLCVDHHSMVQNARQNQQTIPINELKKTKPDYLVPFLRFLEQSLNACSKDQSNWRAKEALLLALQTIWYIVRRFDDILQSVEVLFKTHILPGLKSDHAMLRYRVCSVYTNCLNIKFVDRDHVQQIILGLQQCLMDKQLPVRLQSAHALSALVLNSPPAKDAIKPYIRKIFEVYLQITAECNSSELILGMRNFLVFYAQEMRPFLCQIADQLIKKFAALNQNEGEQMGKEFQLMLSANAILTTVKQLIEMAKGDRNLLGQLRKQLNPIITQILGVKVIEFYHHEYIEECMRMVQLLATHENEKGIAQDLWQFYPQVLKITVGDEVNDPKFEFVFFMLGQSARLIRCFIAKDPDNFRQHYMMMTLGFVSRVYRLNRDESLTYDKLDGCRGNEILIAMLENVNCTPVLGDIINKLLGEWNYAESNENVPGAYKSSCLTGLAMTFLNNAAFALDHLAASDSLVRVLEALVTEFANFRTRFDLRNYLFGIASLIQQIDLPEQVRQLLPRFGRMLPMIVIKNFQIRLKGMKDNQSKISEALKAKNEDVPDFDEMNQRIDAVLIQIYENDENVENTGIDIPKMNDPFDDKEDRSDSEEDYMDYDEPETDSYHTYGLYKSAISNVDEVNYLKDTLTKMRGNEQLELLFRETDKSAIQNMEKAFNSVDLLVANEGMVNQKLKEVREENPLHGTPDGTQLENY